MKIKSLLLFCVFSFAITGPTYADEADLQATVERQAAEIEALKADLAKSRPFSMIAVKTWVEKKSYKANKNYVTTPSPLIKPTEAANIELKPCIEEIKVLEDGQILKFCKAPSVGSFEAKVEPVSTCTVLSPYTVAKNNGALVSQNCDCPTGTLLNLKVEKKTISIDVKGEDPVSRTETITTGKCMVLNDYQD